MKVGFDISQTHSNPAGCGYYANIFYKELVQNKAIDVIGYRSFGPNFFDLEFNKMPTSVNEKTFGHNSFDDCISFWNSQDFSYNNFKKIGSPDITHSNNFYAPPTNKFCKNIYTLYDLSFFSNPDWTSIANWRTCSDGVFAGSFMADHIVTISSFTKECFLNLFPNFDEKKISIIYPTSRFENFYLSSSFVVQDLRLRENEFFLSVGTLEPRKNHMAIIKAYIQFINESKTKDLPLLVFAGGVGWLYEETMSFIKENKLEDRIIFTGYVSDDLLFWLYQNCSLNIYLSHYEGFGMPILEAISSDAFTVTSDIEPFRNLFGDSIIRTEGDEVKFLVDLFKKITLDKNYLKFLINGDNKFLKKFSKQDNVKKLINLYCKL